jgi:nucleoid-associated protein YgaU
LNLKNILKAIKLNESTISMILGAVIIVVVGILVVNYFKGRSPAGTLPAVSASTDNQISNEETQTVPGKSYTVAKGDSLWKIAMATYGSGFNWTDIASANNLKNPSQLAVGQVLSLPDVHTKAVAAATTTVTQPQVSKFNVGTGSEAITGANYTVVKGDNLWKIAVRAYGDGFKWVEIARENKLVHPNLIHSGNVLVLPR